MFHTDDPLHLIQADIGAGCGDSNGIGIYGQHLSCAQFGGSQGQDAGAGAQVQDGHAGPEQVLQGGQAHLCRGMQAGAESHAGIKRDDDVLWLGRV